MINDLYGSKRVAAVCGNDVFIYGKRQSNGVRPLKEKITFNNPAQALAYGQNYDDDQRRNNYKED